jgi:hypothetical protein
MGRAGKGWHEADWAPVAWMWVLLLTWPPACRPALMPVCSIACLPHHPQVNKMASEQRSYSFEPFDWQ